MRIKKVVLDTNLWISFLITNRFNDIDNLLIDGKVQLVFSKESIEEFLTVAKRPKFKKYFSDDDIKDLMGLFHKYGKLVDVSITLSECRDKKDNFLLSLAVESNSDYLVSGDSDLLVIKNIKKTKILSWADFIKDIT